jgi:hypothetical protein
MADSSFIRGATRVLQSSSDTITIFSILQFALPIVIFGCVVVTACCVAYNRNRTQSNALHGFIQPNGATVNFAPPPQQYQQQQPMATGFGQQQQGFGQQQQQGFGQQQQGFGQQQQGFGQQQQGFGQQQQGFGQQQQQQQQYQNGYGYGQQQQFQTSDDVPMAEPVPDKK